MSQGAWIAGGDYRRVNGAATRFAETAVGKHPAPEGALRLPAVAHVNVGAVLVGKHPAPEVALRPLSSGRSRPAVTVGKHPAPEGALRKKWAWTLRELASSDIDDWNAWSPLPDAAVEPHFIESHGGSQEFSAANARSA